MTKHLNISCHSVLCVTKIRAHIQLYCDKKIIINRNSEGCQWFRFPGAIVSVGLLPVAGHPALRRLVSKPSCPKNQLWLKFWLLFGFFPWEGGGVITLSLRDGPTARGTSLRDLPRGHYPFPINKPLLPLHQILGALAGVCMTPKVAGSDGAGVRRLL